MSGAADAVGAAPEDGAALTRSIVLWCPDWPIRAALRKDPSVDGSSPVALIEKGIVFACSAAARAAGVQRGLVLLEVGQHEAHGRHEHARVPEVAAGLHVLLGDLQVRLLHERGDVVRVRGAGHAEAAAPALPPPTKAGALIRCRARGHAPVI